MVNEFFNDPKTWFLELLTTVVGLLAYIGKGYIRRQDSHTLRLQRLERITVTREEFEKALNQRHEENVRKLDKIEELIERNHIDGVDGRHRVADQLGKVFGQVAKLEGRLEQMDKRS